MPREVISTDKAPRPVAPYSQAIRAGDYLFISGQVAIDPATGKPVGGDIKEQTRRTLENIKAILEAAGASLDNVVKVTVFLTNPEDFKAMNEVYGEYFKKDPPARSTIAVQLAAKEFLIEIEAIAYLGK